MMNYNTYLNTRLRAQLRDLKEEIRMDAFCEQDVVPWQDVVSFLRWIAQHAAPEDYRNIFEEEL